MPPTDRVMVLAAGEGAVEPTAKYTDAEVVEAVDAAQKPAEDPHRVCIDERRGVEKQPVREKMAGGNTMTCFAATEWAGWSAHGSEAKTSGPVSRYKFVVKTMHAKGAKLGGHCDNHAEGDSSNCGAADKYVTITKDAGEIGKLELVKDKARADMEDVFDEAIWDEVVDGAAASAAQDDITQWRGAVMVETIRSYEDGVVEELNGTNEQPEHDPDNARHNHWAEAANGNKRQGYSNDRDAATIPFFQYDIPAIREEVERIAETPEEATRLFHAAMLYQYATTYRLTKNMRLTTTPAESAAA